MGSFFAISASPDFALAESLFRRTVAATTRSSGRPPNSTVQNDWSSAASFSRENGSDAPIANDAATGSWLAVVGTCFHRSGLSAPADLLRHYQERGAEQLGRDLEGFFAVILGDASTKEITVITDIVGSCHFYCREMPGGGTALSSSSLVLAALAAVTLDPVGCQEFLGTGVMYEDRTVYREIKKLPPASVIRFRAGAEVERLLYWDVSSLAPESLAAEQATDQLWHTVVDAASKIGDRYESVVCDLTGGYDSRAMAAAFVGSGKKFATTVSGPDDSADVLVSSALARELGLEHSHSPRDPNISFDDLQRALPLTDGEYDVVEYASIARIHRKLSQKFQISINGSFGEVARGYWWELLFPHTGARQKLDSEKLATRRYAVGFHGDLFRPELRLNLSGHMTSVVTRTTAAISGFPNTFQMDVAYVRMRMQRWQGRIASSTNRVWPCLSPFMFRSVLEVMLQTRFDVRQRSLLVRKMLARYQPKIANFPLEHGYPAVPASWKNFWKFWPLVPYYGGKVAEKVRSRISRQNNPAVADNSTLRLWKSDEMRDLLQPGSMLTAEILEPAALASLLADSQRAGFSRGPVWNRIVTLELAYRFATTQVDIKASS